MFKKLIWSLFYILIPLLFIFNIKPVNQYIPFISLNWYINLNNLIDKQKAINPFPFKRSYYYFQDKLFYYDKYGEIKHHLNLPHDILISPSNKTYFTHYKVAENISFYKNNGEILWKMDTFSIPLLASSGNIFALLSTDQSNITLYDKEKKVLFPTQFLGSLLLDYTFVPFNDTLIIGTSKGDLKSISVNGKLNFSKYLDTSQYNYIKSVFTSPKGKYIGVIHGLNPEYISLFSTNGNVIWQKKTHLNRLKKVSAYIDTINQHTIEIGSKNIIFRDLDNGSVLSKLSLSKLNPNKEKMNYMKVAYQKDFTLIAVHFQTKNYAILINKDFNPIWIKDIHSQYPVFVELINNNILIQTSGYIYAYRFITQSS